MFWADLNFISVEIQCCDTFSENKMRSVLTFNF